MTTIKASLLLDVAPEDLLDRLRADCAWPNPGAKRDKLDMLLFTRQNPLPWQVVHPMVRALAYELDRRLISFLNSCAVQRYATGDVGGEWHSDDDLDPKEPVVIVSLGAMRPLLTRRNGSETVIETLLPHRSAFVMPPGFQQTHEHRLPPVSAEVGERIALVYARRFP